MSQKSNPTVIGAFVVGAVALAVIGLLSFGGGELLEKKYTFVMFFEGSSLKGLDVGAPVNFQGVRIGAVSNILVHVDSAKQEISIPVYIELEPNRLQRTDVVAQDNDPYKNVQKFIDHGLRAQLVTQSFVTGKLGIELDLHPDKEAKYTELDPKTHEIPTIPSMMEEITETLKNLELDKLVAEVRSAIEGFNDLVRSPDLQKAIKDADEMILEFKTLANNLDQKINPLVEDVTKTTATLREKVDSAVDTLNETLTTYKDLGTDIDAQIDPLADSLKQTLSDARVSLGKANDTLDAVRSLVAEDSPMYYRLSDALNEASAALRSVRVLADYLEQHPEALIQGKKQPGGS